MALRLSGRFWYVTNPIMLLVFELTILLSGHDSNETLYGDRVNAIVHHL